MPLQVGDPVSIQGMFIGFVAEINPFQESVTVIQGTDLTTYSRFLLDQEPARLAVPLDLRLSDYTGWANEIRVPHKSDCVCKECYEAFKKAEEKFRANSPKDEERLTAWERLVDDD